jgi:polar amino acid transport system substrate-binding protein
MPLIGEKVGVQMSVKNIPWDTIFAGLANGAYDGVASGVTVTEERKATMDFSTPILTAGQVVIIRSSDSSKVKGIGDLSGKKIGVQIGTTVTSPWKTIRSREKPMTTSALPSRTS